MANEIKAPFRYEPSGDCDGEQFGTDHFVVDAVGNEIACAPNEATGRLLAAAPDLLEAARKALECLTYGDRTMWEDPESPYYFLGSAIAKATGGTP